MILLCWPWFAHRSRGLRPRWCSSTACSARTTTRRVSLLFRFRPSACLTFVRLRRSISGRWAITCIELAETKPPRFGVDPTKAMNEIPRSPAPTLADRSAWCDRLHQLAQYFYAVGMAAAFEFIREGSKEDKKIPAIKSNESEPKRITLKDADHETKIEGK